MKKYCPKHFNVFEKLAFYSRVADNGCNIFVGSKDGWGYGQLYWEKRLRLAHRVCWEAHNGPIPAGMLVLHRCDNPACINPDHLWLGTNDDNMADMQAKGRARNGTMAGVYRTPKGHLKGRRFSVLHRRKLTWEQVREIRESKRTYRQLERQFGVSNATIWRVKKGLKLYAETQETENP